MARRVSTAVRKEEASKTVRHCSECSLSYDWSDPDYVDGSPILCRCPHYRHGKWYKFLRDRACSKFEAR